TDAERKATSDARKVRKEFNNVKLDEALIAVWKVAEGLHKDIGTHSPQYWYECMIQNAGKRKGTRTTNDWNAFVSVKVRTHNDNLPPGERRVKAPEIMAQIAAEWKGLSPEEKVDVTRDAKKTITDVRTQHKTAAHNVPLNAFHDARATLCSVQSQLENLYHRSGTETLLLCVRSKATDYMRPMSWSTSDRIDDHFQMQFKKSTLDYVGMLESFMLSGIEGDVNKYQNELLHLKHKTAKLISDKLQYIARPDQVSRMYYNDFEVHITNKFGIIVENWPLKTFASPSNIGSRLELDTLFHAWESGATRFKRLSPTELIEWQRQRAMTRL
ncbi:hypothetical protein BDW22DRAFT_1313901, partial [Trametopsis cervina]